MSRTGDETRAGGPARRGLHHVLMPHNRKWAQRAAVVMAVDALLILAAYGLALLLRFDFSFTGGIRRYWDPFMRLVPVLVAADVAIMWVFRLYHSIWRYVSITEMAHLLCAWVAEMVFSVFVSWLMGIRMPISFYAFGGLMALGFTAFDRLGYRLARSLRNRLGAGAVGTPSSNVLVIGAGGAGKIIVHEMRTSDHLNMCVRCIVDDNPAKRGTYLEGVPVVGGRDDIREACTRYAIDLIVFAIPSASGPERRSILDICRAVADGLGCQIKVVPGTYQLIDGQVSVSRLRPVRIEDLLGRDPVSVNLSVVRNFVHGKVVLVTGGGGSIGSELCRQVAKAEPRLLVIFDVYENNAYAIQRELMRTHPELPLEVLIGTVRDAGRLEEVFGTYRPDIVFHAAAHKHVPLMEDSPHEAIKNNVLGTYNVAQAALEHGTRRFVLISTDKAVNPTNVMGCTKRLCEMIVQMMDRRARALARDGEPRTEYAAVRFGNVLGSNGSVIPLFERQIAEGGPVTVTDCRVVRYFMTIPEAVGLVLQAGAYAHGGEIFVLDMGNPVRIDDLARNLIRLMGYEPDVDIPIVYTGLRPGEKLYEERLMDEENLRKTQNRSISIAEPIDMDDGLFMEQLASLRDLAYDEKSDVRAALAQVVSTYHYEIERPSEGEMGDEG